MKRLDEELITKEKKGNRRRFFKDLAFIAGGVLASRSVFGINSSRNRSAFKREEEKTFPIGVCDWMILERQDLDAFPLSKKIGVDGVEVDMGSLGNRKTFDSQLGDPEMQKKFLDTASDWGLDICSLAMSGFYAQSFAERPTALRMVGDCIDTMVDMKVKIAFLPLGVTCDLVKYPELRPAVVKRLKAVASRAEKEQVIIGVETALDATEELKLLEDIGSPAIQSYFNFANALQNGRDLNKELQILGRDRICQIHCTDEDGVLLQDNSRLDMHKVKRTLEEMGWKGWLVLERSRQADQPHDVLANYGANTRYMKSIFQ